MTTAGKDKRDALLNELESIRAMLDENPHNSNAAHTDNIPLLIPEDQKKASNRIPVLSVRATEEKIKSTVREPEPVVDPLQAIRQAAAKVVANTGRHRDTSNSSSTEKITPASAGPAMSDREKLVDDIVRSALPRLESLLRELVQEALLQEKLRGGKR